MLTDGKPCLDGLMQVHKLYQPDGMRSSSIFKSRRRSSVAICIGLNLPRTSVKKHPLADTNNMLCDCRQPTAEKGRLPMILDVMRKVKAEVGEATALYGLICGPFTLASHLRGNELFMDLILERNMSRT